MSSESRTTGYLYLQGNPKPIILYDKFQFGRMESFDNPAVSRMHFTVAANESGVYFIIDHESRSGTRLDGQQLKPGQWYELNEGSSVVVGPYVFEFTFKPPHKRPPPDVKKAGKRDAGASLESSSKKFEINKSDTGHLHLEKLPRVSSPTPQRPKTGNPATRKSETDEEYAGRLRLFLMICVVITVLTVVVVQSRTQTSREQMFPYYAGYTKIINQYYKNYALYQKKHQNISVYERDQAVLIKELREIESDLRAERPVDRKADYYKKHMLVLISKTHSHSANTQKYFRTGKFNYFSLAKQDDADLGQEMMILNKEFGVKAQGVDSKGPQNSIRVPAAVPQGEAPQQQVAPSRRIKSRDKSSRTPF